MTAKTDIYVIVGVLVSVVTLILFLKNQNGEGQPRVEPVFQVTAPDPTTSALRSNETLAKIGANKDITLAWLQYGLGFKQADTALAIENVDATRDITIGAQQAATQATAIEAQRYTAQLASTVALADIKAKDKASSRSAWVSAITGIGKSILSIFGL